MNNKLENFINNNRKEFDSEEMKIDWEKINSKAKQKKIRVNNIGFWWAVAASIVIFISGLIYFNYNQNKINATAIKTVDLPSKELTDHVDPDYTAQMDQFAHLIKIKQTELQQSQKAQPDLYKQFLKDNNRLDSSYYYLKSKLAANPNKEILLDAMIQSLELKLQILNRQLQIIKQSKYKKENNENRTI